MSHNFKPGDLALIVGCRKKPINLGKTCELVGFLRPGERIDFPHNGFDGVRYLGVEPAWLVAGDGLVSPAGAAGYTIVRPAYLMPLRGDFSPERQKAKEVDKCL